MATSDDNADALTHSHMAHVGSEKDATKRRRRRRRRRHIARISLWLICLRTCVFAWTTRNVIIIIIIIISVALRPDRTAKLQTKPNTGSTKENKKNRVHILAEAERTHSPKTRKICARALILQLGSSVVRHCLRLHSQLAIEILSLFRRCWAEQTIGRFSLILHSLSFYHSHELDARHFCGFFFTEILFTVCSSPCGRRQQAD